MLVKCPEAKQSSSCLTHCFQNIKNVQFYSTLKLTLGNKEKFILPFCVFFFLFSFSSRQETNQSLILVSSDVALCLDILFSFWKQFCKNCFDGSFLVSTVVTYSEFYLHLYTIVNIYRVFEIIFCWNFYSSYGFGFIILVEVIKMVVWILDLGVFRLVVSSFSIHGLFISSFWVRPFSLELIL